MKTLLCNLNGKSPGLCKGGELPRKKTMVSCPLVSNIPMPLVSNIPVPQAEWPGTSKERTCSCARIGVFCNVLVTLASACVGVCTPIQKEMNIFWSWYVQSNAS